MKLNKIIFSLLVAIFFSIASTVSAATITLPVFNDNSTQHTGYVSFNGVPIHIDNSTSDTANLKVTSDEAGLNEVDAQFDVISRYDEDNNGADLNDKIRTVLVTFESTVLAQAHTNYYLQVATNGGNASGLNLLANENLYYQIDTGVLTAQMNKSAGFQLFNKVRVDSVDVVSDPVSDGVSLVNNGIVYNSSNGNNAPVYEVLYNGPLFCMLKATAHLEDSNNNPYIPIGSNPVAVNPVAFDVFYWAYKGERNIHVGFRLKNENPGGVGDLSGGTNRNAIIDHLSLTTTLSGLGLITEIDMDDWSDTTSPSGMYTLRQEHCLPGACAQASESDLEVVPNFNYYIDEGVTNRFTGRRFNSYAQMRDAGRGLMISQEYHWQNWPNDIVMDATNKTATLYLLPDEAEDHIFLGAAWKYWHVLYNFHGNVNENYNFESELAEIKKPLKVLLGDQIALSGFYADKTHPLFNLTATGEGGEKIGEAANNWEESILAQWDSTYSDDQSFMKRDMSDIREERGISSIDGAFNGFIDMYGWLPFGDWVRGTGTWGMNGLNYGWNYLHILNGHKHQKYGMLTVGEQMSIKTADQLVFHAPIDDSTIINSSGITVKRIHGGSRGEKDADTRARNYTVSPQAHMVARWTHGFPHGLILEYALTGKPWLRDSLNDMGDFLRYNYGGINPDHGNYNADLGNWFDVINGEGDYHESSEARVYCRSMGMSIGLYQTTGDIDYYNIAKAIFNNVQLDVETNNEGYVSRGATSGVSPWYSMQPIKYDIMLYETAKESGDYTQAKIVSDYLLRLASWFKRIATEDLNNPAGTYNGGSYNAWLVYHDWSEADGFSSIKHPEYINELADLFAFAYSLTGDNQWLTDARNCFKDRWFYSQNDTSETINTISEGSYANDGPVNGSAWMKEGKNFIRPMYYMNTEYKLQNGWTPSSMIRSDVDKNQTINTIDAMLTLRNSLELEMSQTSWEISATTGDVNCDGNLNSIDAVLLLRYSLGFDMGETDWCE